MKQLTILAKAPHIGKVKTRLTTEMSDWAALQFHRWSLRHVVQHLCPKAETRPPLLFCTALHPFFSTLDLTDLPQLQRGQHLGLKMLHALEESFTHCSDPQVNDAVMLLGTDAPTLKPAWLQEGFSFLNASDEPSIVIGPAEDGGYYTIGCNRSALSTIKPLFDNQIMWGTTHVFEQSKMIAQNIVKRLKILPMGLDVDHPQDLKRARNESDIDWSKLDEALAGSSLSPPQELVERQAYEHALKTLFALTRFGERMDLSAPRAINQALEDPLSSYQNILIGGTNGKGSTSAALSQLGLSAGLKVGCFTSPHLVSFRERIRVGDTLISPAEVVEGVNAIFAAAEKAELTLSFFEATWALAAWFFKSQGVEWVIWEVGLGGRLDATNTCEPLVSAVCSLSLDHTHVLGNTLAEIAWEKSHIYREQGVNLTGCQGEALQALREMSVVKPREIDQERKLLENVYAQHPHQHNEELSSDMMSTPHGRSNVALAWSIAQEAGWSVPSIDEKGAVSLLKRGFAWPGRLERLEGIWLDCAHNEDSAFKISDWLDQNVINRCRPPRHLIIGMSADKDIDKVLMHFASCSDHLTFVSPLYPRCASAYDLLDIYDQQVKPELLKNGHVLPTVEIIPSVIEALRQRDLAALTLVTGSCFLVGEARAWLLGINFPELNVFTSAR